MEEIRYVQEYTVKYNDTVVSALVPFMLFLLHFVQRIWYVTTE